MVTTPEKPAETASTGPAYTWDVWAASTGLPLHRGYYIEDLSTLPLGRWEERECDAAFVQLAGQEGITETRVTEVPARATLPPVQLAFDEIVYVVRGRGATTVTEPGSGARASFEWTENCMFMLPRGYGHQFHNTSGSEPARLLHYNYLPLAMTAIPEPSFFFNKDVSERGFARQLDMQTAYAEAKAREDGAIRHHKSGKQVWEGRFFPDMARWDKLGANTRRGAGGRSVYFVFPGSEITAHMSVFPTQTYKKAHRHGPGRAIVIPAGEGYSIMWEEGKEKVVAPWKPGSMITPPDKWFHQHFNVGRTPARYLALHPPMQFNGHAEKVEDRAKDQIEYTDEEPWIREKFEAELAKRGLTSNIPPEAYQKKRFEWETLPVEALR